MNVIKSDILPPNTMIVSEDIYQALTETPTEAAGRVTAQALELQRLWEGLRAAVAGAGAVEAKVPEFVLYGARTGRMPTQPQFQEFPKK